VKFQKNLYSSSLVIFLWVIFYPAAALAAAPNNANILDNVLSKYSDAASTWSNIMVSKATWLFWSLALLSMAWTYGMMALRKADLQEAFYETVRFFSVTGFFWWILKNGPAMATSIIDSMRMIGAQATGLSGKLSPSGIVDMGFDIFFRVLDQSSVWSPVDSMAGIFMSGLVLIILAIIGINMLLILISSWILAYGGVFFLGFGGARWTSDIAINYYKTVLGVGVQLMGMVLIVGIGKSFLDQYYNGLSSGVSLKELAVIMVVVIILFVLTNKVPAMLAGIVSPGFSAGSSGGISGGAMMGAAGVAAAAVATGGAMALGGASHIAGGASALKEAFQAAQQNMANGTGKFSGSGSSDSGNGGGLSQAMGTAGKFASDMMSNLAKGIGSVAKDKAGSMMDSAKENISQTTGGKIASAIRNSGASNTESKTDGNSQQNNFGGDSLSAGNGGKNSNSSKSDEVNQFVNKGRK
jgi:type IV secretion system protein TrbL